MLTRFQMQNFKAWKDTGKVVFAPITVFFGKNSSGKTSLHQLLLMLKQTTQSPDRQRVLHFGDKKTLVDLGSFRDAVFRHDAEQAIEFRLSWRPPEPVVVVEEDPQYPIRANGMEFSAEVRQNGGDRLGVAGMKYVLRQDGEKVLSVAMTRQRGASDKYDLTADGYKLTRKQQRPWPLPAPTRFYGFPDEAFAYYQNTDFLSDLALEWEKLMGRIHYVGPLRQFPRRIYPWSGDADEHVGQDGDDAVKALLAAKGRMISRGFRAKREPFHALVARWLKQMGLIHSFKVVPLAQNRSEYEVLVQVMPSSPEVKITDVGFGVSQVLPVLVECFYVKHDSIVVFEQPEIHLHPRVQASLADLFIEAVHAYEDGRARRTQIVVESHSEHFLRRLQRRIAEGTLKPEEAAVYFCEPGAEGAVLKRLEIDLFGNITNWPDGFFGDEIEDLTAMTVAAQKRQKELKHEDKAK